MDFSDRFRKLADRLIDRKPHIGSEEATKHSLVVPFIRDLGYDIYNPAEVVPEYTADVDIKKGEKVDYAILKDGKPILLIECKDVGVNLNREHRSQLTRYFMVTRDARYAILTNGLVYQFFTELDEKNRMDIAPFLTIDMENLDDRHLKELERFTKDAFDEDKIFSSARELRFMREIGDRIAAEFREPSEQLVRHFAKQVYSKPLTQARMEEFARFVREALRAHVNDLVRARLQSAMQTEAVEPPLAVQPGAGSPSKAGQKAADTRMHNQASRQSSEEPDYSKYQNWEQLEADPELYSLFNGLVEYLNSLGKEIWIGTNSDGRWFIVKPKDGHSRNICTFAPKPRKRKIVLDIAGKDGPKRDISNHDDLERAKPLIKRSYDEAG